MSFVVLTLLLAVPLISSTTLQNPTRYGEWSPQENTRNYFSNQGQGQQLVPVRSVPAYPQYDQSWNPPQYYEDQGGNNFQFHQISQEPATEPQQPDKLKEKLGFSLSSLLPTSFLNSPQASSQDSDNDIDDNNDSPFLDDTELLQNPSPSSDDNPALFQGNDDSSLDQNQNESGDEDSSAPSGGLFSRIRNVLPFGNGLLSGLFSGGDSSPDSENADINTDNDPNNIPNDANSDEPNSFPLDPSQVSLTNEGESEVEDEGGNAGSGILSTLLTPLRSIQNFFTPADSDSTTDDEQLQPQGVIADLTNAGPSSVDNPQTVLQSLLADGGMEGIFGGATSFVANLAEGIGITSGSIPYYLMFGLGFGPIVASVIAGSVIAIIYASIYIPSAAFRNEGADGDLYMLPIREIFDILGVPDPLEQFLDALPLLKFNFKKRSLDESSPTTFGLSESRKRALLTGTIHESKQCIERYACEVLGKKILGSPRRRKGWLSKGIMWLGERIEVGDDKNRKDSTTDSLSSRILRIGKKLIKAAGTGISLHQIISNENKQEASSSSSSRNSTVIQDAKVGNACVKYVCDPMRQMRQLYGTVFKTK